MEGRSGRWGCGGDSHLNSRSTSRLGHGDLRALKPQAGEENQKANCQGKTKINSLPKVQQKWPDLPRRRASSCGESLGWEEQRPFLLAAWAPAAGAGTSLGWNLAQGAGKRGVGREAGAMWGLRVRKWDTRAQEHGKLRPRVQAGVLQWWGALAVSFSFVQSLM